MVHTRPTISVVIPTFDDWDPLEKCLACLAAQDLDPELFEIIIANNNASNVVPDSLIVPENARVIWVEKPGSYAARNAAMQIAGGQFIFFTDSDCLPNSDWLSAGLAVFRAQPDIIRCAGAIDVYPASGTWNGASLFDALFSLQQAKLVKTGRAATANLAVRRCAFDVVGAFRESSFSGGDMEWNERAQAAGLCLKYVPDMIVRHPARDRLAQHVRKTARKTGASYTEQAKARSSHQLVPPLENVFPSVRALSTIFAAKDVPFRLSMAVWGVHSYLRWVKLIEVIRLGWFNTNPERR
ncbi:glycosyltransferase family 2 protein [Yoonia algicola]|uniref:Glycosyltransferase n=1 Tax=Yoonia algicola TaxID=3137368 RepID=A0AAN0M5I1_9RHOB